MAIWLPTFICTMRMARYRAKFAGHDGCKAAKSLYESKHQYRPIRHLQARTPRKAPS
jgi:hypothetical protein